MAMTFRRSEISTFKQCRLRWWFKYREGLVPKEKVTKLRLGDLAHAYLQVLYAPGKSGGQTKAIRAFGAVRDQIMEELGGDADFFLETEKLLIQLRVYTSFWFPEDKRRFKFLKTEFPIIVAVEGFEITCRLDCVWEDRTTGKIWVVEHKTASSSSAADNLLLDIGDQPGIYLLAAHQKWGKDVGGLIWNVIVKSKKHITQKDEKTVDPTKTFLKRFAEEVEENSHEIFLRRPLRRNKDEMERTKEEISTVVKEIFEGPSIYRAPTGECSWKCPYSSLCINDTPEMRNARFDEQKPEGEEEEVEG